jgi:hypothetical protein
VLNRKYSVKENRIKVREKLVDDLLTVKTERGAHQSMATVPGGKTGLVTLQPRAVGTGENQKVYMEQVTDSGLVETINNALTEIAQEVGQWKQKHEVGGITDGEGNPAGVPVQFVISQDEANL